jgi:MFS family permease
MSISMMVGILSSGIISDKLGLKLCLILGCAVQTLGWVMLFWAPGFLVLIAGRIVSGIGSGKSTLKLNIDFLLNNLTSECFANHIWCQKSA